MEEQKKLSKVKIYLYGLPDFSLNFLIDVVLTYIVYFAIDIARVPAVAMGTAMTVATVCDAFSVPIAGAIMNKIKLRWGRFRSWILIASPIASGICILLFQNFNFPTGIKTFYYGSLYILMFIFINLAWTGHIGLINKITRKSDERIKLSSAKAQLESVSAVLVALITLPLINFIGKGDESLGFSTVVAIYAVFNVLFYYLVAFLFKDCDREDDLSGKETANPEIPKSSKASVGDMLKQIVCNRPLLTLLLSDTMRKGARNFMLGLAMYFFKYVCQNPHMQTTYLTTLSIVFVAGSFAAPSIAVKLGTRRTYIMFNALYACGVLAARFAGRNAIPFIALVAIGYIGHCANQALSPALFSDCAKYAKEKTGKDTSAFIMSLVQLPYKLGAIIGSFASFGLAKIGYDAAKEVTDAQMTGINNLITLVPGIMLAVSVVLMLVFYNLRSEKSHEE